MLQDHCTFCCGKRGEGLVQCNMSQTLSIQENYLVLFVYPGICFEIYHVVCPTRKNIKKIMGSQNLRQAHLLEVGLMHIPVAHALLSTTCHVGLHGDFSSTNFFFGPLGLHLLVWSELGWSPSFRQMRALTLSWSGAFSLMCEVALKLMHMEEHLYLSYLFHRLLNICIMRLANFGARVGGTCMESGDVWNSS